MILVKVVAGRAAVSVRAAFEHSAGVDVFGGGEGLEKLRDLCGWELWVDEVLV